MRVLRTHWALLLAGGAWAALCTMLAADGQAPSRVFLPIPREHYYAVQALLVIPMLSLQWRVCLAVVSRSAGGVSGDQDELGRRLSRALGVPLLLLFVVPDAIAYLCCGFDSLGALLRVTAPLSFAASVGLAARAVHTSRGVSLGRALLAGAQGVLAQALLGAPVLR